MRVSPFFVLIQHFQVSGESGCQLSLWLPSLTSTRGKGKYVKVGEKRKGEREREKEREREVNDIHVFSICNPLLQAEACRAVATEIKKCPNGMYAEIKYDGERVQVHKQGDRFEYFSRSLKPVGSHKVHCMCRERCRANGFPLSRKTDGIYGIYSYETDFAV